MTPEIVSEYNPLAPEIDAPEPTAFGLGSIVVWSKPVGDSEIQQLTSIVNGNWPDGQVSLFVFHFDGQYLARIVPVDQLTLICSASDLLRLPDIVKRVSDLENAFMLMSSPATGASDEQISRKKK